MFDGNHSIFYAADPAKSTQSPYGYGRQNPVIYLDKTGRVDGYYAARQQELIRMSSNSGASADLRRSWMFLLGLLRLNFGVADVVASEDRAAQRREFKARIEAMIEGSLRERNEWPGRLPAYEIGWADNKEFTEIGRGWVVKDAGLIVIPHDPARPEDKDVKSLGITWRFDDDDIQIRIAPYLKKKSDEWLMFAVIHEYEHAIDLDAGTDYSHSMIWKSTMDYTGTWLGMYSPQYEYAKTMYHEYQEYERIEKAKKEKQR
jgi:hypothetical protein